MKHNAETLADENGFEILVGYDYESTDCYYEEVGNPGTLVPEMVYTELTSCEVLIGGVGIDLLPMMSEAQKEFVIRKLQYD